MRIRLQTIAFILATAVLTGCAQEKTREEKADFIIGKLKFAEVQKMDYQFRLEPLKRQATGADSLKIIDLEKELTDEAIAEKIRTGFRQAFSDKEIDVLYQFLQTSAFEKLSASGETFKTVYSQFDDIDEKIEEITKGFDKTPQKPKETFEPIPIDRPNGFYAATGYTSSTEKKDIEWEEKPSMTPDDILELTKGYNGRDNFSEIGILFTKEGAQKFYLLTKNNVGKPLAIVIDGRIVSMPFVNSEIMGGRANVTGYFSEEELDRMMASLKKK